MTKIQPSPPSNAPRVGPSIECSSVSVSFIDPVSQGPRAILNALDMCVPAGSLVALLGRSGCGKSTLLRCIAGLQAIDSGEIRIGQRTIDEARDSLSFVFQEPALLPWRTAVENVQLPLELKARMSRAEARKRSSAALRRLDFAASDDDKLPTQLSGGMKMRASLARSLITEPYLLLLDEPFAALDDMLRWKLNEILLSICEVQSRTMLFVTHNIAEAIFLSDKIAIMHRGQIALWIDNPLPHPRTSDLRATAEFAVFYGRVSKTLADASPEATRPIDGDDSHGEGVYE